MDEYKQRKTVAPDGRTIEWPDRLYPAASSRLHHHLVSLREALQRAIETCKRNFSGGTVLDFGCGEQPYRPLFEALGASYLGYDLAGNEKADGIIDEKGSLDRRDGSVDVVFSSQVLEHVNDPAHYLAESVRVLRAGGVLILSTHGVWRYHPDPRDYWRWTGPGLRKIVAEAGLEISHFEGVVGPGATAIQLWQDAVLERLPASLRKPFCYLCQWAMRRADRKSGADQRKNDAQVFVCVARKGSA